jgi:hypothetical protein
LEVFGAHYAPEIPSILKLLSIPKNFFGRRKKNEKKQKEKKKKKVVRRYSFITNPHFPFSCAFSIQVVVVH